jgi:hypothetical protein
MNEDADVENARPASGPLVEADDFHLFETEDGPHLLVLDGSQIFKIDEELRQRLCAARAAR